MMCVLMGVRDADRLARACDLGLAMQLTNIARDVGEDARAGRIYLPRDWLDAELIDVSEFFADPRFTPAQARVVARLLDGGTSMPGSVARCAGEAAIRLPGARVRRNGRRQAGSACRSCAAPRCRSCPDPQPCTPAQCPRWRFWSTSRRRSGRAPAGPRWFWACWRQCARAICGCAPTCAALDPGRGIGARSAMR